MDDSLAQSIDPHSSASDSASEATRRKRQRWIWILVGLGAFAVISIVALVLLATLVVPNVLKHHAFTVTKRVERDIFYLDAALEEFAANNGGKFPDSIQVLVTPDANGERYFDAVRVPRDPWGREYIYEPPGPGGPRPIVKSYGKDGRPGGKGDDADVDSLSIRGDP
ncbi:MAG TPA: type II secretion system protein GspG [Planctomycetota bacterium]|jgi:general secretion pathway protein G|nr:type II secretion system protein GspG [Planctomycetota bacterium]